MRGYYKHPVEHSENSRQSWSRRKKVAAALGLGGMALLMARNRSKKDPFAVSKGERFKDIIAKAKDWRGKEQRMADFRKMAAGGWRKDPTMITWFR